MPSGKKLTRREFLQAGGALALTACTKPRRTIDGEIVGASHRAGHLLREARSGAPSRTIDVPVVIAGAGIAGLSAAWKLRKAGVEDFLVLELEAAAGGNSRWGSNAVTAYPWAAHYVPLPGREARAVRELFEELGVIVGTDARGEPVYEERYLCAAPHERLFLHGRWHDGIFPTSASTKEDLAQLARFRETMASFRGGFSIPVDASDPKHRGLDAVSMREWMDREGFTAPRLRWYVEYACRDDYGCTLDTTSAWAGIHYYASRPDDEEVLTWPAGNGWIAERLSRPLDRRLVTNALVTRVDATTVDYLDVRTRETIRVRAKHVIFALPRFLTRHLMGVAAPGFTYAPWVTANVTVDEVPAGKGAPPCWDNVFYESPSLGYVVATHQHLRTRPGPSVLTWYQPFPGDPPREREELLRRPWEAWRDLVIADLRRAHPDIESRVGRIDVMLLGHGMIRPVPGFLWGPRLAALEDGPVVFAHSDMSGISIFEEAQYRGVKGAETVLRRLGKTFTSSV